MVAQRMKRKTKNNKESLAYILILIMMTISMTGLPYVRYAIYLTPVFATIIWLLAGGGKIRVSNDVLPFLLLLLIALFTTLDFDENALKKLVFVGVYVYLFLLFDFSKIEINILKLGVFFVLMMVMRLAIEHRFGSGIVFSIADSKSTFESTLSFPLGLIGLYYLTQQKYSKVGIFVLLALVSLKRIVLLGLAVALILAKLPKTIRPLVINPYTATAVTLAVLFFSISFANNDFDKFLIDFTGMAPNDLSKGRQELWSSLLDSINYEFEEFIVLGLGNGSVVSALQNSYQQQRILVHNDILMLYIEFGLLFLIVFTFLLNRHKDMDKRILAAYITIIFITDNVIIYQHVMITYLLLQSQLTRIRKLKYSNGISSKKQIRQIRQTM